MQKSYLEELAEWQKGVLQLRKEVLEWQPTVLPKLKSFAEIEDSIDLQEKGKI
jgi:hypothetical protein